MPENVGNFPELLDDTEKYWFIGSSNAYQIFKQYWCHVLFPISHVSYREYVLTNLTDTRSYLKVYNMTEEGYKKIAIG